MTGTTSTITCTPGRWSSLSGHGLTLSSPEPVLGRYVRLQRVTDPQEREAIAWKEVTVISAPADLSQEEKVKVLVDSTVM